jgi:hypothetical protein
MTAGERRLGEPSIMISSLGVKSAACAMLLCSAGCRSQNLRTDEVHGAQPTAESSTSRGGPQDSPLPLAAYPHEDGLAEPSELHVTRFWMNDILISSSSRAGSLGRLQRSQVGWCTRSARSVARGISRAGNNGGTPRP